MGLGSGVWVLVFGLSGDGFWRLGSGVWAEWGWVLVFGLSGAGFWRLGSGVCVELSGAGFWHLGRADSFIQSFSTIRPLSNVHIQSALPSYVEVPKKCIRAALFSSPLV